MPAQRLHLPLPPPDDDGARGAVVHVYHTADPIPQGGMFFFLPMINLGRFRN
jgi:putative lipase involved disintegration of autophagic bodies